MSTLYDALISSILTEFHLSTKDIAAPVIDNEIFPSVMKAYSRSRGTLALKIIPLQTGVDIYTLDADIFYIDDCLWNELVPTEAVACSIGIASEEYYHPTLAVIQRIRDNYANTLVTTSLHTFDTYRSGNDKKIKLCPLPTTDIYVIYRQLMTKDTYPEEEEHIIALLLKAKILRYCQSTGLIVTLGDITYAQSRMDRLIDGYENDFYRHMQLGSIGRS